MSALGALAQVDAPKADTHFSYKPRSIHTPHPRRIASMAESALDGSALGRVRGVTPPLFLS